MQIFNYFLSHPFLSCFFLNFKEFFFSFFILSFIKNKYVFHGPQAWAIHWWGMGFSPVTAWCISDIGAPCALHGWESAGRYLTRHSCRGGPLINKNKKNHKIDQSSKRYKHCRYGISILKLILLRIFTQFCYQIQALPEVKFYLK